MKFEYPHVIDNGHGEKITFLRLVRDAEGDRLEVEGQALPGAGPPMHVHYKQDEGFTIVQGSAGIQIAGEEPKFVSQGESVAFKAGVPHKFWNTGSELLITRGWIKPACNVEYFLTQLYASTAANGGKRPGIFDSAWLLGTYRSEFGLVELPAFVKNVIFPIVLFLGEITGRYKKFKNAPKPL